MTTHYYRVPGELSVGLDQCSSFTRYGTPVCLQAVAILVRIIKYKYYVQRGRPQDCSPDPTGPRMNRRCGPPRMPSLCQLPLGKILIGDEQVDLYLVDLQYIH